jgi:glucosamine--fructose-6-phosphate aminotransferase (isomerizing)
VASTKAFTTQLAALVLTALGLAHARGRQPEGHAATILRDLDRLPALLERTLELNTAIEALAPSVVDQRDFIYLARGINYPSALEGALKLKEISYIHAEGYPAGEMKHGPIALIDVGVPVVVLAADDRVFEKTLGNVQEAKARGGRIVAVTSERKRADLDSVLDPARDVVLTVPDVHPLLLPILLTVPLQLLAYHLAVARGCDVDQPRNLAKSVTVE